MRWEIGFFFFSFNRFYWWIESCWKTWVCWKQVGGPSNLNINFSSQRLFFWKRFEGSLNWGGHMHFACCGLLCCCVFWCNAMLHCRGRVKVLGRHILEPQRQVRILFLIWDVSYEQNWALSDENSRFEIKSSESSGGNISSFRNVASDLLHGLSWPPSVSATASASVQGTHPW